MNIQTFVESETQRMRAFKTYWETKIVPHMTDNEAAFWETEATVWDWIEQLEDSGL